MMSLLCIYRGYEMEEWKGNEENHYCPQTETTLNNELNFVHEKIGIFPNRCIRFINNTCLI